MKEKFCKVLRLLSTKLGQLFRLPSPQHCNAIHLDFRNLVFTALKLADGKFSYCVPYVSSDLINTFFYPLL